MCASRSSSACRSTWRSNLEALANPTTGGSGSDTCGGRTGEGKPRLLGLVFGPSLLFAGQHDAECSTRCRRPDAAWPPLRRGPTRAASRRALADGEREGLVPLRYSPWVQSSRRSGADGRLSDAASHRSTTRSTTSMSPAVQAVAWMRTPPSASGHGHSRSGVDSASLRVHGAGSRGGGTVARVTVPDERDGHRASLQGAGRQPGDHDGPGASRARRRWGRRVGEQGRGPRNGGSGLGPGWEACTTSVAVRPSSNSTRCFPG